MTAHKRHGTWVLLDGTPAERGESERNRDGERLRDEGDTTIAEQDAHDSSANGKVGLLPPHIVHMNGRSFLPPDVKRKVEAEFRRQAGVEAAAGGGGGVTKERLKDTLRAELGLS
jgi:hypothetical protein